MPSGAPNHSPAADLSRWPQICAAQRRSLATLAELQQIAGDLLPPDEGSLVVFGSLARGEYTEGSDLDWALIIDGRADSGHLKTAHELRKRLTEREYKVPGPTGLFGGLVFSHELIHAIGGEEDTNGNMTRRLLLLLESAPIAVSQSTEVHARLIRGILSRYVEEDANFTVANRRPNRIPRFLLNDVVRFWRTMAVDYANKYRKRAGEGWALRNIKLRMSRKLIFTSGLLMCLSWALDTDGEQDDDFIVQNLVAHLIEWTQRCPLQSLALAVDRYGAHLSDAIFGSYNEFLSFLESAEKREELQSLDPEVAYENPTFLSARKAAHRFDDSLLALLFDSNENLTSLVKKYGVF